MSKYSSQVFDSKRTKTEMYGAKLLLETLAKHGVQYIFTVPGRESEAILFNESPNLEIILTAIEFTAGFAAYAYGIVSGRPQVVFSTLGPGVANLANAIYSAYADRVPIIFITAQVERSRINYNQTHQCINAVKMYESVTKFGYEINDVREINNVIEKAFQITQVEPLGPALISIPIDVLKEDILIDYQSHSEVKFDINTQSHVDSYGIDLVVSKLKEAEQPLVYVGNEVIRSGCVDLIRVLCETYKIPMVSAYDAKGVLPTNHQLNYFACTSYAQGILGINPDKVIFEPIDCIIAFGYDWKDDVFPGKHFSYGKNKTLINFSGNMPDEIRSKFIHIEGDIKAKVQILLNHLAQEKIFFNKPHDISIIKEAIIKKQANLEAPQGYINIISVLNIINESSVVLVSDVGTFRHYAVLFGHTNKPNFFLTSAGSSSFGTGLPLGLGARLAYTDKDTPIVVLTGDGGFNTIVGDLRTLRKLDLNITIIVLNNNKNGLINIYQQKGHGQTFSPAVEHAEASFVKIAQGYNCQAFRVFSSKELRNKLKQALEIDSPVVIEVSVYYPQEDLERLTRSTDLA